MPKIAQSTTGVKHEIRPDGLVQLGYKDTMVAYCGYEADNSHIEEVDEYPDETCKNCSSIRKGKRSERYNG